MPTASYEARKGRLEDYFDRTASETWARLTSDAPVSRIRATVRQGRDEMRALILDWLGEDLTGRRILDAGCGTGALAIEAAARGADVVAIDIAASLVRVAAERMPEGLPGTIDWHSGDMCDPALGDFDHVVAMDSLIHYDAADIATVAHRLAERTRRSMVLTFAPRTAALTLMHAAGQFFPRSDRSPAIEPVSETRLRGLLSQRVPGFEPARTQRVARGFYTSQAIEVTRKGEPA
jgi:magnesium-protoporphyrin O-methyltransferase